MTGNKRPRGENRTGSRQDRIDLLGPVVPARPDESSVFQAIPEADLSNVIPFTRRKRPSAEQHTSELPALSAERLAPPPVPDRNAQLALILGCSLAVHAGLFAFFNRPPPPLASIGVVSISVDLVLGAEWEAGLSHQQSQSEVSSAAAPKMDQPDATTPETARQQTEKPQAEPTQALPLETPPEPQPNPEIAATPKPPEKPTPAAKPQPEVKRAKDNGRNERNRSVPASTASTASDSVGHGRSDAETNYRGVVYAHLRRYQQFPSDARSRGQQGTSTVTFGLDGGGRVTSVRLAHSSGIASLDQEAQAMARRASPFPAPPSGRPQSFTAPIVFNLR